MSRRNAIGTIVIVTLMTLSLCGCAVLGHGHRIGSISDKEAKGLVFFDTETTGLNHHTNRIIEITMYSEEGWLSSLCAIDGHVPGFITDITGITDEMLKDAPRFEELAPEIYRRFDGRTAVAHNAQFDMRFLLAELARAGVAVTNDLEAICTLETERKVRRTRSHNRLEDCIRRRGIEPENTHRAEDDVRSLIELYKCQKREGAEFVRSVYHPAN
jgi:DNA polymerase-3 subunit epsilon